MLTAIARKPRLPLGLEPRAALARIPGGLTSGGITNGGSSQPRFLRAAAASAAPSAAPCVADVPCTFGAP